MQGPERAFVAQHEQPAVVARPVAVLAPLDDAVQRREDRRAGRREQVDGHVPRAPAPVRRLELGRGVDLALLVVAADRETLDGTHLAAQVEHRRRIEITLDHGRAACRREELADPAGLRARLVPARVAEAEVRELRILARETLERLRHARLADQQVLVVRRGRELPGRHRDAQLQPHAHQLEQHRELVLAQRRHLVVAAHHRHDRTGRVRLVLHRVRARDREPAHAGGPDDVAEVDQPRDRAVLAHQHVVLVGVVVDDLVRQVVERGDLDALPARVAQIPRVRAVHRGVLEARQRPVDPRHGAPEARQVATRLGPRPAVEPAQQPDRALALGERRAREPRHRGLVPQVLEHGVLERRGPAAARGA